MTQVRAIHHVESGVTGAEGIDGLALRYGFFYGPGTGLAEDGSIVGLVRKRRFPIIGGGAGVWSFPHVDDAASATLAAIGAGHPACTTSLTMSPPAAAWLPGLAEALGVGPPRRLPEARRSAARIRRLPAKPDPRSLERKVKRELAWPAAMRTWREGPATASQTRRSRRSARPDRGACPPPVAPRRPSPTASGLGRLVSARAGRPDPPITDSRGAAGDRQAAMGPQPELASRTGAASTVRGGPPRSIAMIDLCVSHATCLIGDSPRAALLPATLPRALEAGVQGRWS